MTPTSAAAARGLRAMHPVVLTSVTLAVLLTSCGPDGRPATDGKATTPRGGASPGAVRTTSSPDPSSRKHVRAAPACRTAVLTFRTVASGSVASQPFADVEVVNRSSRTCTLAGYPHLSAEGRAPGDVSPRPLRLRTTHGLYERRDQGPRPIRLRPSEVAYFSVGTDTAYGGHAGLTTLTTLLVGLDASTARARVQTDLFASTPDPAYIPVAVTAFTRHTQP